MASIAKKIKTKLTSTKHGRYTLDDSNSAPKVLLQKVSQQVEANTQETLYSDSGGVTLSEKPFPENGYNPVHDKPGDKVWLKSGQDFVDEDLQGIDSCVVISNKSAGCEHVITCSAGHVADDEISPIPIIGSGKHSENDAAKLDLVSSCENTGDFVKTGLNQNIGHASTWYTDDATIPSSDMSNLVTVLATRPSFETKSSTIWYDLTAESSAAVRTSIDSGYEKSPDPTLEPPIHLLTENSATSISTNDALSKKSLAFTGVEEENIIEFFSSSALEHTAHLQSQHKRIVEGEQSAEVVEETRSEAGWVHSAEYNTRVISGSPESNTNSEASLSSKNDSKPGETLTGDLSCSKTQAQTTLEATYTCKHNSKQSLTGKMTCCCSETHAQHSDEPGSGCLPCNPSTSAWSVSGEPQECCILPEPGHDETCTPVGEHVLCIPVATTPSSSTPGCIDSPAEDHRGSCQLLEVSDKNNTVENTTHTQKNENLLNAQAQGNVLVTTCGISEDISPTSENGISDNEDVLNSGTVQSQSMNGAISRSDTSACVETNVRHKRERLVSDRVLFISEEGDEPMENELGDDISARSEEASMILSIDPEINEIVKNYDNVFFKKTGNKCIITIGDKERTSGNLNKDVKISNLDGQDLSTNDPSLQASLDSIAGPEFVQLPEKELCDQQSDDNNLDSFDELEADSKSSDDSDKLKSSPVSSVTLMDFNGEHDSLSDRRRSKDDGGDELDNSIKDTVKLDSSMEEAQTDIPTIIFEMDEDKLGSPKKHVPVSGAVSGTVHCCCSCHKKVAVKPEVSPLGVDVFKRPVTRSVSDEPVQKCINTHVFGNVSNRAAFSSLSEPAELNSLGRHAKTHESVDCVSDLPNPAAVSIKTGASQSYSFEVNLWNDLSGDLAVSTNRCSCPELSINNLDSPPSTVERRKSNDPLPPLPPFHSHNIPQDKEFVSDHSKSKEPKFEQFACGHQVPLRPAKPELASSWFASLGVQNETYAMLKDVRVDQALAAPRVRRMLSMPAVPSSGRRSNSLYCDNRTYVDTCDINVGGSTACNCDSRRSRCAPSRKTLDDVPPPVPKRNYSLYSSRTRQRHVEDISSSDSDSSGSANSLDDLPNLNKKKHAIPNEYIDSDEFPRSPASNEDLRRWEDALSLPTLPDDPESANLFHIHNSICDMCRLRGQGKKLLSPSKSCMTSGLRPLSSGSVHPLCIHRDDVKFIRASGQQLDPGTGKPINPPQPFYDSDSESDSGISTELPKSRSSSSGEMMRLDRYKQNLLKPNAIYARSQKAKSLPQNFANKTYISDAIFHEDSKDKSQQKKAIVIGIPGQKPPPVPKRNYLSTKNRPITVHSSNPPALVPRKAATLTMNSRSFSDEDLVNEPIHMSLQEMGRDGPIVDLRSTGERNNRPDQLQRPLSCSPTTHYMHQVQPAFVDLPPILQKGKSENTDSSDDSVKDKAPHVPPREKKKNPLSALFKPKQKLGNIFHWKSKDGKEKSSQQKPHRKLPPLPPPEQEVIFCPDGEATSPTEGACGGLKDIDKDGQNSSNFIDSLIRLREVGWYWGPLNLEDAEAKLINKKDGSFLVRDSSHDSYILSLSFRSQGKTHHTRIEHCHGTFGFWSQPVSHGRMSIIEFIERAMEFSRNGKFLYFLRPHAPGHPPSPVALLYPISRFEVMQSLQHACRFVVLKHVRYDHIEQLPLPRPMKRYLKEKQYFTEKLDNESDED